MVSQHAGEPHPCVPGTKVEYDSNNHYKRCLICHEICDSTIEKHDLAETSHICKKDGCSYQDHRTCEQSKIEVSDGSGSYHYICSLCGKVLSENPTDPVNPENPADPQNPENSENPADLQNPENPTDPQNPENPADPQNPNDPGTNPGTNPGTDPGNNSGTTPMVQKYTITIDGNGGKWSDGKTTLLLYGEKDSYVKLPIAPVKPGYTFLYWKGSVYYPGDYYLVQGDHTLTAEWKENVQKPETNTGTNPGTTPENKPGTNPETTPENKPGTNPETPENKPGTNPETTPENNSGTNPKTPGQSSDQSATPQDTLTEAESTTDKEEVAPKTGDYTILIVSALALLAIGSGMYLMRKKENEQ